MRVKATVAPVSSLSNEIDQELMVYIDSNSEHIGHANNVSYSLSSYQKVNNTKCHEVLLSTLVLESKKFRVLKSCNGT